LFLTYFFLIFRLSFPSAVLHFFLYSLSLPPFFRSNFSLPFPEGKRLTLQSPNCFRSNFFLIYPLVFLARVVALGAPTLNLSLTSEANWTFGGHGLCYH
jgi:hypothetical protein